MQLKLPDAIQTEGALQALLEALQAKHPHEAQASILKLFWEANPKISPDENYRKTLVEQMEKIVTDSEKVTISLAQIPDSEFLTELVVWFRSNVKPYLVLEVQVEPILVGGMVLRTREHIYDWSLQRQLTQTKPKLTELLYAR